jgi:hypothetical protein
MSDDTQTVLQQLIELQTESLRLQRLLLERLAGPSDAAEPEPERPPLRVVGGTAERYYKSAASAQASVSLEQVETLRAIQDAGETARLVLAFGPHAGESLGQVAQADPGYLRTLALSARRPDVRAAARHIISLLPDTIRRGRSWPSARAGRSQPREQ